MIYESYFYKDELKKISLRMKKRLGQKRWADRSMFLLEKDTFVAFYFVRKLIEAKTKLSTSTSKMSIELRQFDATGKHPTISNNHKLNELYDLERPTKISKPLTWFCNQIVHSYAFALGLDDDLGQPFIFVNSFNERQKALYQVFLGHVITVLETIANDYPSSIQMTLNPDTNDYDVTAIQEDEFTAIAQERLFMKK